jgi:hypothetical protein
MSYPSRWGWQASAYCAPPMTHVFPPFRPFQSLPPTPAEEPSLDVASFIVRAAKLRRGETLTEREEAARKADNAFLAGGKQRKGG